MLNTLYLNPKRGWFVRIPPSGGFPGQWINLALVSQVIIETEDRSVTVFLSSGSGSIIFRGDRAKIFLSELKEYCNG